MTDTAIPPTEKRCSRCTDVKPLDAFAMKYPARGIRQSHCRACQKLISKANYDANPGLVKSRAKARKVTVKEASRGLVADMLANCSCTKCNSTADLTFYANRSYQGPCVSAAVNQGLAEETVRAAIQNSVILCKSCMHKEGTQGLEAWQIGSESRKTLMEARAAGQLPKTPKSEYKSRYTRSAEDRRLSATHENN